MREDEVEQRLETSSRSRSRARAGSPSGLRSGRGGAGAGPRAGLLAWAGAVSQGADVAFGRMLEAGANCLPVVVLFLGLGGLAVALFPRAVDGPDRYALVGVAFLWETVGADRRARVGPRPVALPPRRARAPRTPFQAGGAATMAVIGALAGLLGAWRFERRDLSGP